jgi:lipoate synthase
MLGLGETEEEVLDAMRDMREAGVDVLTLGNSHGIHVLFFYQNH